MDPSIVLPPAVAGAALLRTFERRGSCGPALNLKKVSIHFTRVVVVNAQKFTALFYFLTAAVGFSAVDRELPRLPKIAPLMMKAIASADTQVNACRANRIRLSVESSGVR